MVLATPFSVAAQAADSLDVILAQSVEYLQTGQDRLALDLLLTQESLYTGNPDYDYALGVAALECNEYMLALHAFERVTLQTPNHAGAWIDLALTHIRLGDIQSAEALLGFVEQQFAPRDTLRQQIQEIREQLKARQQAEEEEKQRQREQHIAGSWRGEVWMQAGRTSNANAGIALNGLSLTPVGADPIYLPLDPSRKPRSDALHQWRGIAQHTSWLDPDNENAGIAEWIVQGRKKDLPNTSAYRAEDFGVAYSQERAARWLSHTDWRWLIGGSWQSYRLGGAVLMDSWSAHTGIRQPLTQSCSAVWRIEWEHRDYQPAGYVDADLNWLTGRLFCGMERGGVALGVRVGTDTPVATRAGGTVKRREMTVDAFYALRPDLLLDASVLLGVAHDQTGYSPLVEYNKERYSHKNSWRLGMSWMLDKHWALIGSIEDYREAANMPLFDLAERQYLLGLRYGF